MENIAIVVPYFRRDGGVSEVARFLYNYIKGSEKYRPSIVSLASSSTDGLSTRLLSPSSWFRGRKSQDRVHRGIKYTHFGCSLAEFEFLRYCPRAELTDVLNRYDLAQVVAGHPAWSLPVLKADIPVALQVATLARLERASDMITGYGLLRVWRILMTHLTHYLGQIALRRVEAVFVENKSMLDHVSTTAPSTEVVFAPPGIDTKKYSPSETPFGERDYILSVGRFADRRKNVGLLFMRIRG